MQEKTQSIVLACIFTAFSFVAFSACNKGGASNPQSGTGGATAGQGSGGNMSSGGATVTGGASGGATAKGGTTSTVVVSSGGAGSPSTGGGARGITSTDGGSGGSSSNGDTPTTQATGGSGTGGGGGSLSRGGSISTPLSTGGSAVDGGSVSPPDAGTHCSAPVADPYSISIAGQWDFTPAGKSATKIQVPGGGWVKQGFSAASGTYQTKIAIPNAGSPQTTLLEFGAINYQAALSVDGQAVATNTTAFTPSVFDVTKFVKPGQQHTITLVVKGRDGMKTSSGKDTVPVAAGWSANVPQGIYRSAMIRVYPDVYISDAFVRPSVKGNSLTYDVWITNTGSASRQVTLSGKLESWNCDNWNYPTIADTSATVAAGATQKVTVGPVTWGLGTSSYWWPNIPYQDGYTAKLHSIRLGISDTNGAIHTQIVRFGFRDSEQLRADTQHVYYYLNGIRVNFRGDSLQGADYDSISTGTGTGTGKGDAYDTLPGFLPPSMQNPGWPQAVRNYQRLNYSVVRIHQELAAPYMLDTTDELGLMLINETAIRGSDNAADFVTGHDNMVNHARAMVLRDRNHPSIIRWSQSNEANNVSNDSVQFERDLYTGINTLDPTRPISADLSGDGRTYDAITNANFSAIGHYIGGFGVYTDQVASRTDRPFGQGEFIWLS